MQGLFSFRGTMDRRMFAAVYLGVIIAAMTCALVVTIPMIVIGVITKPLDPDTISIPGVVMTLTSMGILGVGLWVTFAACAKRLRSAGLPVAPLLGLMILMPVAENIVLRGIESLQAFYVFWDKPFSAAVTFVLHLLMFLWPPRASPNIADAFGAVEGAA